MPYDNRLLPEPEYLTQVEAASFLGLSPRTLEKWRIEGQGPAYYKFGRRVLYLCVDLRSWADAQRRQSTSDEAEAGPHARYAQ